MAKNQPRTAQTLSIQDINDLRFAARVHDEHSDVVALCDLALEGEIDMDDYTTVSRKFSDELRSMTRERAYELCAEKYNETLVSE